MKKNTKGWIAEAIALGVIIGAIVAAIIYGIKLVKVIILNWSTIVDWLSANSITTASISVGLFIIGYYCYLVSKAGYRQHGFAHLIRELTYKTKCFLDQRGFSDDDLRKTSGVLFIVAVSIFIANTFPLFNHFNLLKLWLIILGGIAILSFGGLMFFLVKDCDSQFWPLALITFCLLAFTYYLDLFIFSWSNPRITGITAVLVTTLFIVIFIRKQKKSRKEKLEKAQYDAECSKMELQKIKEKAEAREALRERLASLSFNELIISYFNEKKENELILWSHIVLFYIEACKNIKEDGSKVEAEQKIHIAWLLSQKTNEKSSVFYKLIAQVFEENDTEALLFSNVNETPEGVLPEAFAQISNKKAVIASFLSEEFDEKYKKILYNKIKREFAPNEFYGLVNALIYSYQKTWDEEFSAKLLDRIKEVFTFANDCLDSMWQKGNKRLLRKHMEAIYSYCLLKGVHAHLPIIKQELEETKA